MSIKTTLPDMTKTSIIILDHNNCLDNGAYIITQTDYTARIGVMSEEMLRKRAIAIVKGEYKPAADEPKVWFTSLNAVAQLFCDENQQMLK